MLVAVAGAAMLWELAEAVVLLARGRGLTAGGLFLPAAGVAAAAVGLPSREMGVSTAVSAGAIAAIAVCCVSWALRSYRRTTRPIRPRSKALLVGLKIAAILLLATWTLRPSLAHRGQEEVRGVILLGVDTSASMRRRDVSANYRRVRLTESEEPARRIDTVRQALEDVQDELRKLLEKADVEVFAFDSSASPAVAMSADSSEAPWRGPRGAALMSAMLDPDGAATALGDSAEAAWQAESTAGREVAGIVLISDGCNNTSDVIDPDKLSRWMAARGVPLYTVGAGSEEVTASMRGLSVRLVGVPDRVGAYRRMTIRPKVEAIGLDGRDVEVTCRFGDEVVGRQRLRVSSRRHEETPQFIHVPLASGYQRLEVSAEVVGERPRNLAGRPSADMLVQVIDPDVRILYVEGRFRYETKYITRALEAERRFAVDRRILLQPLAPDRPPPLSEELDDWLRYHAIIFGDVAAEHFTTRQLDIIKELVGDYGKGFCMIGGQRSFADGGWGQTPIADILPVDAARSTGQIDRPLRVVPTDEGESAELMQIADEGGKAADAWARLGALPGANALAGIKPGAVVLAEAAQGEPMVVTQRYGKGRTLAIAFDTTWRWMLSPEDTAELQKRFWRQAALYLSAPKGNVWIHTDRTGYDLRRTRASGRGIEVTAGVEDPSGRPMHEAPVAVTLTDPGGETSAVHLEDAGQMRKGKLPLPSQAGIYTLKIEAKVAGKELAAEHKFNVVLEDLESMDVLANHGLLRRMAAASNGRFVPLVALRAFLADLEVTTRPRIRPTPPRTEDLAGRFRWWVVVAVIALLCAEWALRKRMGLI